MSALRNVDELPSGAGRTMHNGTQVVQMNHIDQTEFA